MDFWKEKILILCLVTLESVASDTGWTCDRRQYVEFGQRATISCIFPSDYRGVYWYGSADISAKVVIRREKQDNGNFITAGEGHSNGSYEIEPDGSLVITNVSNVHDRVFYVSLIDDDRAIYNFEVEVVTIYNPGRKYPTIDACHSERRRTKSCIVSSIGSVVKCTYSNTRPAVSLSWHVQYPTQEQYSMNGSYSTHLDSKFTYTSTSTVEISGIIHNPLVVLTCTALGPPITSGNAESFVVVDGTNSSYVEWQNVAKYDRYVHVNSREELHCNNMIKQSPAYMWKLETRETAQVLMYFMNRQKWLSGNLSGISFTEEGFLIFEKTTVAQEGTYTCVTVNNEQSALTAININTLVPPLPPGIDVAGCPTVENDCELSLNNNTSTLLSCNVTGVKPKVSLSIQSLNSSGVIILTQKNIENNQGELFNVAVVAEVEVQENATCPFIVTCIASGPGSQSFNPRRTISLIPETCQYAAVSPTFYIIAFSTVGVIIVLILIGVYFIAKQKMASKFPPSLSPVSSNKRVPLNPKVLPDAIMDWPLGNVDSYDIFDQEAIDLLYNVSEEIERNRTRKNLGVAGGSVAGIVAGGLSIAGTVLISFTFGASVGLIVAGGVVGAAGAGLSIGFSLEKLFKDKKRVKVVQPALDKFIEIQKELATTVALLSVVYDILMENDFRESLNAENEDELRSLLRKVVSSHNQHDPNLTEKLATIHSFTDSMTKHFINVHDNKNQEDETKLAIELTLLKGEDWHKRWQDKLNEAKETPFDVLDNAVNKLRQDTENRLTEFTFFKLVKVLYIDGSKDVTTDTPQQGTNQQPSVPLMHPAATAAGAAGRVVAGFGDDATKLGANVARVARGVTVAGIVLSAVGIAVDLAFLGHAVWDLLDTKKEQFSQALTDAADIMAEMNKLISTVAKLDNAEA